MWHTAISAHTHTHTLNTHHIHIYAPHTHTPHTTLHHTNTRTHYTTHTTQTHTPHTHAKHIHTTYTYTHHIHIHHTPHYTTQTHTHTLHHTPHTHTHARYTTHTLHHIHTAQTHTHTHTSPSHSVRTGFMPIPGVCKQNGKQAVRCYFELGVVMILVVMTIMMMIEIRVCSTTSSYSSWKVKTIACRLKWAIWSLDLSDLTSFRLQLTAQLSVALSTIHTDKSCSLSKLARRYCGYVPHCYLASRLSKTRVIPGPSWPVVVWNYLSTGVCPVGITTGTSADVIWSFHAFSHFLQRSAESRIRHDCFLPFLFQFIVPKSGLHLAMGWTDL